MNKIILVGNAGKDAEHETVKKRDGSGVLQKMTVAVADSNRRNDSATWYKVVLWGNRAEKLYPIIKKGMKLTVIGRLEVEEYTSNAGEKRTSLEISADEIEFTNPQHSQPLGGQQPIAQSEPAPAPAAGSSPPGVAPDIDKEIPF